MPIFKSLENISFCHFCLAQNNKEFPLVIWQHACRIYIIDKVYNYFHIFFETSKYIFYLQKLKRALVLMSQKHLPFKIINIIPSDLSNFHCADCHDLM
jgi:hypothetical protein